MSKIITRLTDSELNQLFEEYNYDNIILYFEGLKPYYVIPKLLALDDIPFSDHSWCSKSEDGYVYSGNFCDYRIHQFTGLNSQEYFDLLVLHINDTQLRPKCDWDGTPLRWSGSIRCGYGSHGHLWNESLYHFCSRECAANYQYSDKPGYETTKEFIKNGGTFGSMSESEYNYTHASSRKSNFINQGDPNDECYFYVAVTSSGLFKFGITADIENRLHTSGMVDQYISIHILDSGTRTYIAELEFQIKVELDTLSEYFDSANRSFWTAFRKVKATLTK